MKALKTSFNRMQQTVQEQLGDAQKTELDPETTRLLQKADDIKSGTDKILAAIEIYLQPDPAARLLPGLSLDGLNKAEYLGQEMTQLGTKLGVSEGYGAAMLSVGDAFTNIGHHDRDFLKAANDAYLVPMKKFIQDDLKILDQERKMLNNKRLDMDALKIKASKPDAQPATKQEFAKAEEGFNEQLAKVKSLINKVESRLPELKQHLKDLIQRQLEHLNKCQQTLTAVQNKL